jgi:hypothetical protein
MYGTLLVACHPDHTRFSPRAVKLVSESVAEVGGMPSYGYFNLAIATYSVSIIPLQD